MADKAGNKIIESFDTKHIKSVKYIAMNLRAQDFDELYLFNGVNPFDVVLESWVMSSKRWIVLNKNDVAVAVLGVRPLDMYSDIGIPWLIGTKGLEKMKKFFVKYSKMILEEMKKGFKILINFVDAKYLKAVKWLDWCGFIIDDPIPCGAFKLPFHRFYMECE